MIELVGWSKSVFLAERARDSQASPKKVLDFLRISGDCGRFISSSKNSSNSSPLVQRSAHGVLVGGLESDSREFRLVCFTRALSQFIRTGMTAMSDSMKREEERESERANPTPP